MIEVSDAAKVVFLFVKIVGAIFAILHLLAALVLARQVYLASVLVHTHSRPLILFFALVHVILLASVLAAIIILPIS